ncbi:hypothetical protein GOP47_0025312 [Adiantum capillus-veneris]|uniref:Uncharacterized protein n=1 Tax=Adiantum capillus-veneris TaxID=13818 RepID=A0A9D4U0G1_ADICA|nr:hypothetical protein GOP47_0025312 [Adiantum capillus-veneris]
MPPVQALNIPALFDCLNKGDKQGFELKVDYLQRVLSHLPVGRMSPAQAPRLSITLMWQWCLCVALSLAGHRPLHFILRLPHNDLHFWLPHEKTEGVSSETKREATQKQSKRCDGGSINGELEGSSYENAYFEF